ncbi:MAG: RibD family protein [Vampirovibrio sp.]|nr:RibD family protein [Vampirovibrio sp.]
MRVIACLAASLDGKISPAHVERYTRITTDVDIQHLCRLRDTVQAVVYGGNTFRAYPKKHRGLDLDRTLHHVILTRGQNIVQDLPIDAPLFQENQIPIWIFIPQLPSIDTQAAYPDHVQWRAIDSFEIPGEPAKVILNTLAQAGLESIMVEGGGEVVTQFLKAQAIQELYLTLSPLFLGNQAAGLTGNGNFPFAFPQIPQAKLLSVQQLENELYLHYQLAYETSWPIVESEAEDGFSN